MAVLEISGARLSFVRAGSNLGLDIVRMFELSWSCWRKDAIAAVREVGWAPKVRGLFGVTEAMSTCIREVKRFLLPRMKNNG